MELGGNEVLGTRRPSIHRIKWAVAEPCSRRKPRKYSIISGNIGVAEPCSRRKSCKYSIISGNIGVAAPEPPSAAAYVSGVLTGVKMASIRRFPERATLVQVERG